jgi:hypothetical protein
MVSSGYISSSGGEAPDVISLAEFSTVLERAGVADPLGWIKRLLRIPGAPGGGLRLFAWSWCVGGGADPALPADEARRALNAAQARVVQGLGLEAALSAVAVAMPEEEPADVGAAAWQAMSEAAGDEAVLDGLGELPVMIGVESMALGELWVRRVNVAAACRAAGESGYPWPDGVGGWRLAAPAEWEPVGAVLARLGGSLARLRERVLWGDVRVGAEVAETFSESGGGAVGFVRGLELAPEEGAGLLAGWPAPVLVLAGWRRAGDEVRSLRVLADDVRLADDSAVCWAGEAPGGIENELAAEARHGLGDGAGRRKGGRPVHPAQAEAIKLAAGLVREMDEGEVQASSWSWLAGEVAGLLRDEFGGDVPLVETLAGWLKNAWACGWLRQEVERGGARCPDLSVLGRPGRRVVVKKGGKMINRGLTGKGWSPGAARGKKGGK